MRETLFNWLTGYLEGAQVLDLFAGSGALGMEALSRGAQHVSFVELNEMAATSIRNNLELLHGSTERACNPETEGLFQVHHQSAQDFLNNSAANTYDLLLLDPPFSEHLHEDILVLIQKTNLLKNRGLIYIEAPQDQAITVPSDWSLLKEKSSGQVRFSLFKNEL